MDTMGILEVDIWDSFLDDGVACGYSAIFLFIWTGWEWIPLGCKGAICELFEWGAEMRRSGKGARDEGSGWRDRVD